ncbi:MAG: ankyrin repeat domain-containing protein [bacterium]
MAKALIEAGADLSPDTKTDVTALMLAAMKGYTELIDPLIKAGADVNAETKNGATPLTLASSHGHPEFARALIEAGANLNALDNRGRTPLMLASVKGYKETVSALINAGANIRIEGDAGVTALRFASRAGHVSIADLLVEAGADTAPEPTTIVATVKCDGDKPNPATFDASGNAECGVNTIEDQTVAVNDNSTLRNVVVSVKNGPIGFDRSLEKPVVDQEHCTFEPRVTVAKVGQTVVFNDSDQGLHNVRGTLGGRQLFNQMTFKGTEASVSLDQSAR